MLKLSRIKKDYIVGETPVHALKGVDLEFRENEFVAILGHSGCGKTTLLNIIGGLDRYSSGDLIINNKSTKLTTKESELLILLCAHANDVLQRELALKTIWIDDNYFNARSMDVYITKLRKHLREDPDIEINNVHGKGYRLIAQMEEE